MLQAYSWPGNVRELENVIERTVVLSNQPILTPEDLPMEIRFPNMQNDRNITTGNHGFQSVGTPPLEEVKRQYVISVLNLCNGNVSLAARTLNIDRRSLYRMLSRYKLEPFGK